MSCLKDAPQLLSKLFRLSQSTLALLLLLHREATAELLDGLL